MNLIKRIFTGLIYIALIVVPIILLDNSPVMYLVVFSGLIALGISEMITMAKDDATHRALSAQLSARQMEKHYRAVVNGVMKETSGTIDAPIGRSHNDRKKMAVTPDGRSALTEWTLLQQGRDRALLDVHIITGRTHQIRVHMASIHHPVLGDPLYGTRGMPHAPRLMLHAYSLAFTHPATGERLQFTAPPESSFDIQGGCP